MNIRICQICGKNISNRHHNAKYCCNCACEKNKKGNENNTSLSKKQQIAMKLNVISKELQSILLELEECGYTENKLIYDWATSSENSARGAANLILIEEEQNK